MSSPSEHRSGPHKKRPDRVRMAPQARRRAIVSAAWEVFLSEGFERASMSAIAARAGGSKATVYVYFRSKEELFAAALHQALLKFTDQALADVAETGELRSRLAKLGKAYLKSRLSPDLIKIDRALIGAAQADLTAALRVRVTAPQLNRLVEILAMEAARGRLRQSDPHVAAAHFRALVEADLLERRLHGDLVAGDDIRRAVHVGVATFLRAYELIP